MFTLQYDFQPGDRVFVVIDGTRGDVEIENEFDCTLDFWSDFTEAQKIEYNKLTTKLDLPDSE